MRSCIKLALTGFVVGLTMFFGSLCFPRTWIKPEEEGGLAALLFLIGLILGGVTCVRSLAFLMAV